jgi:hypothetical protein
MQKRNFGQAKRAKENARKERQQKKLERRHSRSTAAPAPEGQPAEPTGAEEKPAQ